LAAIRPFKQSATEIDCIVPADGIGREQVLVREDPRLSSNLERVTRAFLPPGKSYGPDQHNVADEMFLVIRGQGEVQCNGESELGFAPGDLVCVPSGVDHTIVNTGDIECEFIFTRIRRTN
jgi:mannose-6-phosphate isomerase-like protein (cupin superfamily)